ncbi:hypothetical protein [Mycobacteroides franklinii]|uniref:Uncharacterized protein n=1 Tax=Mycobacteroides franklinii TaxID=948102 RepID=A0A4R5PEV3_9MYCO|nr:hypothetical protein [Mycobacteroides franklinii]ORA64154.1 hypothetical protein BST24_03075 [Mycobacteroides franklinii]TDH23873.1 hypothetical protein EJ571_06445 [Mycobacteroides franklinii]
MTSFTPPLVPPLVPPMAPEKASTRTFTYGGMSIGASTGDHGAIDGTDALSEAALERRVARIPRHVRQTLDGEVADALLDLLDAAGVHSTSSLEANLRAVQVWLFARDGGNHRHSALQWASATAIVNTLRYTTDMSHSWLRGPDVIEWAGPCEGDIPLLVLVMAAMGYSHLAWTVWDAWNGDGLKTPAEFYPWVLDTPDDVSPVQTIWMR